MECLLVSAGGTHLCECGSAMSAHTALIKCEGDDGCVWKHAALVHMPSEGGAADMKVAQNMVRKPNQHEGMMLNSSSDRLLTPLVC